MRALNLEAIRVTTKGDLNMGSAFNADNLISILNAEGETIALLTVEEFLSFDITTIAR
jgi:hypothetical protein